MKKIVMACVLAAAVLLVAQTPSYAVVSLLNEFIKGFSKRGQILELRALPDGSYDIIWRKGDSIMMNKIKGRENYSQTPVKEYDVESLKKLTAGAGKAQSVYADSKIGKASGATIVAITIRPKEGGTGYEFLVHVSMPRPDAYRKSFVVDATTWELGETPVVLEESPRATFWSKEEVQVSSNDIEAVKAVSTPASGAKPDEEAEAKPADEGRAGREGAAEGGNGQGANRAGRGGRGGQGRNQQPREEQEQAEPKE